MTNSATWTVDQGVVYAATGLPLTRVASVSAAGTSIRCRAGVYTFYSGDASAAVIIAYNYTTTSVGNSIIVPQALIGPSLTFSINFTGVDPSNNGVFTGVFNRAVCTDFDFQTKLEDFAMPDFQFSLFTDASGSIGQFNFADKY